MKQDARLYEPGDSTFPIRIYLSALTLVFLVVAVKTRGIGVLEATVLPPAIHDSRHQIGASGYKIA